MVRIQRKLYPKHLNKEGKSEYSILSCHKTFELVKKIPRFKTHRGQNRITIN